MKKDADPAPGTWIGVSFFSTVDLVNQKRAPHEGLQLHKITSADDVTLIKESICTRIKAQNSKEIYITYNGKCKGLCEMMTLLRIAIVTEMGGIMGILLHEY